ncbi:FAD-dependent oxidoreductase [Candidatus Woesearchaeota archaeon]|nr:FAD-dependent oxidoreductase [Candidatus Woesearchaeota archaeon]MBL7050866.1 FAD-dependent oxidoreductase [Candidatus Woesearchaeota archaeon]
MEKYDTIIIGSGPAGLTAAIYTVRYNLKTLVIGQDFGLITEAHKVENYPGFESASGFEIMEKINAHAIKLGAEIVNDTVLKVEKEKKEFIVKTGSKKYQAPTIIIASGTKKRKLNIPGEEEFLGKGVSYCATCDGPFFKDKIVGIVGGNDSAVIAAELIAQYAKKVYIIYRKEELRAKPALVSEIKKNKKIEIINNTNVTKVKGDDVLKKAILDTGNDLELDGLFIEIGTVPVTALTDPLGIKLTSAKFIETAENQSTNVNGVFAAGDITTNSNNLRQMITAASEGSIAATSVFNYVRGIKK